MHENVNSVKNGHEKDFLSQVSFVTLIFLYLTRECVKMILSTVNL